ncbi:SOS response-associated peptidase [Lichenibacterium dinghuense]|uniref:SOS response-associated peptidase n=1 Tax=Lichenibacterium dinghuense TaxID=2895977 RepID=UPI001F4240AA|nr:SOS response-associated peptidase [Lichenibacterium sp. 6Y81]
MCGRFTQSYTWDEIHALFEVAGAARNLRPRYNIAPTTEVDAVVDRGQGREVASMRWGLVPAWWKKGLKEVPATFNARAETVASKPMFRDAFRRRRCIVPASGFFEWTDAAGGKQPHFFSAADGGVLAFAGLWDRWTDPASGDELLSCTVIVSGANGWMAPYHDRMPVLLGAADVAGWLSVEAGPEVLRPAAEAALREWPVSKRVNRPGADDDPALVEPVDLEPEAGALL